MSTADLHCSVVSPPTMRTEKYDSFLKALDAYEKAYAPLNGTLVDEGCPLDTKKAMALVFWKAFNSLDIALDSLSVFDGQKFINGVMTPEYSQHRNALHYSRVRFSDSPKIDREMLFRMMALFASRIEIDKFVEAFDGKIKTACVECGVDVVKAFEVATFKFVSILMDSASKES